MHFCPQCHVLMEAGEADGIRFLSCRSCSGIWLEGDAFDDAKIHPQFVNALNTALPQTDHPASSSGMLKSCIECIATTLQPKEGSPGILACPGCHCVWLPGDQRSNIAPKQPAPIDEVPPPSAEPEGRPMVAQAVRPGNDDTELDRLEDVATNDESVSAEPTEPTSRWSSFWQNTAAAITGRTEAEPQPQPEETEPQSETDEYVDDEDPILAANDLFVAEFDEGHLQRSPAQKTVVLTCMDSRIPVWEALGLQLGDAHILRNAGGVVTEDVIRSLILSHQLMGTNTVLIINHTDCGLLNLDEAGFRKKLIQSSNSLAISPAFFYSFTDLEQNVREQMLRIESHPWIPEDVNVRGFVYDVRTGKLQEVEPAQDWNAVGV